MASEPPFLIGHQAHRELETLPKHLDQRNFAAVRQWAYDNAKQALSDWMDWRGPETYLQALDEGFRPTTLYFGISMPEVNPETEAVEEAMLESFDEEGVQCIVLFSRTVNARQYCTEMAVLEEGPARDSQAVTGEIVPGSMARIWQVKAVTVESLRANALYAPIILDPTINTPGTRLRVADLEDND